MVYVEIVISDNKAKVHSIGKFKWDGKKIEIDGDEKKLTNLVKSGLMNRYENKEEELVYMEDGLLFLENLCYNFWGSRLWATEVKNG